MSRITVAEALKRRWITPAEAKQLRSESASAGGANGRDPQRELFEAARARWGAAVVQEHLGAVPGRKFRLDLAFPAQRLAVECDGFRYHRSLGAFKKDRQRQNLLVLHGWRVLRYFPGQIFSDLENVLNEIGRACDSGNVPHGTS